MIRNDFTLTPESLKPRIERLFELSAAKIRALEKTWDAKKGSPVFTVRGLYTSQAWTEWTQGFQFGSALLQFDVTGEQWFLDYGRRSTLSSMAPHVSHFGVHDHGFNNISSYGNLARLAREGKIEASDFERHLYELALKVSGAVQAARWTGLKDGRGFIYSFNGPHSLFADTLRSLRSLAVAHRLGHALLGEMDNRVSLLWRLVDHASVTAEYSVYYGEGRDVYDTRGRVAHESIFNVKDGNYRCPNSQQGYSPFTTWTRGLAWIVLGLAEQLEYLETVSEEDFAETADAPRGRRGIEATLRRAAEATADYFLEIAASDGIPYWDTGAPGLHMLGDYANAPSNPYNPYEPVDSSAAAIAAQGLWRLGRYLGREGRSGASGQSALRYRQAALTIAQTLFSGPYLSESPSHQGLILHSVYHRPRGWDFVPPDRRVPCDESSMWGDYHARELGLLLLREALGEPYYTFFGV